MAETGRTEDGGYAIRVGGGPWEEVDAATYHTAQQGRVERVARSLGANVVDSAASVVGLGLSSTAARLVTPATCTYIHTKKPGDTKEQNKPNNQTKQTKNRTSQTIQSNEAGEQVKHH